MQDHESARTLIFPQGARSVVGFDAFRLDLSEGLLTRDGEEVRLPPRAMIILQQLAAHAGRIVSKHALMEAAWKGAPVSETSLTEAIGLVRQALGDDPQKPRFIQTVHRRGYRFIAPLATEPAPPSASGRADEAAAGSAAASGRTQRGAAWGLVAVTALIAAGALWIAMAGRRVPLEPVIRASVDFAPEQQPIPGANAHPIVAFSPDGRRFVYVGGAPPRLYLRELSRFEAVPLPGTEGAHGPFFSPAGDWVAFFAQGRLKKVRATGDDRASPQVLCATERGVGGAWVSAGEIVFAPNWEGPLMRVSAAGGRPVALELPAGVTYRWPDRLDDETVLATRWRSSAGDAAVVALSLSSGAERVIAEPATFGRFAADGHVLFLREGDLFAVPVDPSGRRRRGAPVRVAPAVMTGTTGAAQFAVSPRGPLLYIEDDPKRSSRTLARVDRRGSAADLAVPPRDFRYVAACGDRLAATVFARGRTDLWVGHLDRAALTRLTREGAALEPVWSPDCRTIAFSWNRGGVPNIYTTPVDSGDAPRVLFESPFSSAPGSWSADGRWLAYTERHPETSSDVWLWDRATGHRRPVIATPGTELLPALSPDGKYVAYETSAAGAFEVEVARIDTGARIQVSVDGGTWPSWSADGRELFFLRGTTIMRTGVEWHEGQVVTGDPVPLFSHPDIVLFKHASDRFVWLRRTAGAAAVPRTNLVLNWAADLDTRVP